MVQMPPLEIVVDQINETVDTIKVSPLSPRMVEEENNSNHEKSQMVEQVFELGFDTLSAQEILVLLDQYIV